MELKTKKFMLMVGGFFLIDILIVIGVYFYFFKNNAQTPDSQTQVDVINDQTGKVNSQEVTEFFSGSVDNLTGSATDEETQKQFQKDLDDLLKLTDEPIENGQK